MSTKLPKLDLRNIEPMTDNQRRIFDSFENGKNLFINGSAGTGKTFVSIYLALREIYTKPVFDTDIYNITIVRSAVPSRDIGFLPGNLEEKAAVYEGPYRDIVNELLQSDIYDSLKKQGHINFSTTSFMRGLTIDHSIVIVDESSNLTFRELNTIMTRMGDSSRIIFCGDFFQSDLKGSNERKGIYTFMKILSNMNDFDHVEMTERDIVRSGIVRDYIISMNQTLSGSLNGIQPQPVTA